MAVLTRVGYPIFLLLGKYRAGISQPLEKCPTVGLAVADEVAVGKCVFFLHGEQNA